MSPVALPVALAAVLHGPSDVRIEQRTAWNPHPGEAQLAVMSTGLCGSDLHYYTHGRNGDFALRAPLVLGHEACGVVTALGEGVSHLKVGQRVALEAGVMCRACESCLGGRYNLCARLRFASSAKTFPHLDGTLQTRMNHPAHVLHPIPDRCSVEQASLAEPLSVVLHALRRAQFQPGQSLFVIGAGTIGLLACALARALGAARVCVADINPARLAFAEQHAFVLPGDAWRVVPDASGKAALAQDERVRRAQLAAGQALDALRAPGGFDVVAECTGVESSIQTGIFAARTGGKLLLVGMGTSVAALPISSAATREVDIVGTFRYANTYPSALAMLASGALPSVGALVTHRLPLERAQDAFELMRKGVDEQGRLVMKIMVQPATKSI